MAPVVPPTEAQFRANFPEFADTVKFTTGQVQLWLDFAVIMVVARRWTTAYAMGIQLFAAHNLYLEKMAQNAGASGGVPGGQIGVLTSKAVGPVSASYDANSGIDPADGHWNLSTYGSRFIRMVKLFGAGPIQI